MGLQIPDLDDTTFEKLVEEARLLIGRYTAEWTDHNVHDPGITFIELFAWLAEMQIYQLNRVTDAQYEKFLQLVGITLTDVQPASVRVVFKDIKEEKIIAAGTPISTEIESKNIAFEVEEGVTLLQLALESVKTVQDTQTIDNTAANEADNMYFFAFGEKAQTGADLRIEFDKNLTGKEIHLVFDLWEEPGSSSVRLVWEYLEGSKWKPFNIKKDTTAALSKSGKVIFIGPPANQIRCRLETGQYEMAPTVKQIMLNTLSARQVEKVDKDLGKGNGFPHQVVKLEKIPVIGGNTFDFPMLRIEDILDWTDFLNILTAQAASSKPNPGRRIWLEFDHETQCLLEKWDGIPVPDLSQKFAIAEALNQAFHSRNLYDAESFAGIQLPNWLKEAFASGETISGTQLTVINRFLIEAAYPEQIAKNRLVLEIKREDGEWQEWVKVTDFESSGPEDGHYMYDPAKGEIIWGNGLNGLIPQENQSIRATYKTTLGPGGNVPKNQIFKAAGIAGINPEPAAGGRDAESVKEAKARARKDFNTTYRAIISSDYEKLALETPGLKVARAKAIPNYNPGFPCIDNFPGTVTVVVVPKVREGDTGIPPVPGEGFLETVRQHLDKRRLVTTDIYVIAPEYVKISVTCRVKLKKKSSPEKVKERIQEKLKQFLHPLTGGPGGKGWSFGRAVYPSEIYQLIDNVEGVDYASGIILGTEEKQYQPGQPVKISSNALVFSGEHQVEVM